MLILKHLKYDALLKLCDADEINDSNFELHKSEAAKLIAAFEQDAEFIKLNKENDSYLSFSQKFEKVFRPNCDNARLECGISYLYILDCLGRFGKGQKSPSDLSTEENDESDLMQSLQQKKWIKSITKYVLSTAFLASLDLEASLYLRKKYRRAGVGLCSSYSLNNPRDKHRVVKATLRVLLALDKIKEFELNLTKAFLVEILAGLLQASFCPRFASDDGDTAEFRSELELILESPAAKKDALISVVLIDSLISLEKGGNGIYELYGSSLNSEIRFICDGCARSAAEARDSSGAAPPVSRSEAGDPPPVNRSEGDPPPNEATSLNEKNSSWLRRVCRSLFARRFLLRDGGLRLSLDALSSALDASGGDRAAAAASLVSQVRLPEGPAALYRLLCPQVLEVLNDREWAVENVGVRILSEAVEQLFWRSPELTRAHLFEPLLAPLHLVVRDSIDRSMLEADAAGCIAAAYDLFVRNLRPDAAVTQCLDRVAAPLLRVAALPPTCHVKSKALLILVRYLNVKDDADIVEVILELAGIRDRGQIPQMHPGLRWKPEPNRLRAVLVDGEGGLVEPERDFDERSGVMSCLVEILEKLRNVAVLRSLILELTECLDFTVLNDFAIEKNQLLTPREIGSLRCEKLAKTQNTVVLLNSVCESTALTDDLFVDVASSVSLFGKLLEVKRQHCENHDLGKLRDSFVEACVLALSYLVGDQRERKALSRSEWRTLGEIAPILREISDSCRNAALAAVIGGLLDAILTYGCVSSSSSGGKERKRKDVGSDNFAGDAIPSALRSSKSTDTRCGGGREKGRPSDRVSSSDAVSFSQALRDVCSPHLPVRAHALVSFKRLIAAADPDALAESDKIFGFFELHLKDADSYVYLAALEGMVSLSLSYPDKVVILLTEEFSLGHQSVETRLKLAEILTRTAEGLGPLLPKYKGRFLNCLLGGVRDPEPLVRAASLSNLGEVCKQLKFSVQSVLQEIFEVVRGVVELDRSIEVKRAAVLLVSLLIEGLGKDTIKVLQSVILELYRSLKAIARNGCDDVLAHHAESALDRIDAATKQFLVPKMEMTKRIYIADVPPEF